MSWLIYGANGYTGELCAREAVARGLAPTLAGRNADAVGRLAAELELPHRSFSLDDRSALRSALEPADAVLHCAGPFVLTCGPMLEACLETGTHYLDITGEIPVFERAFRLDDQAKRADIALLPGVGFDVVPTDCLAAALAARRPEAIHLELAFHSDKGAVSPGTMKTMIEALPDAGAVRENGRIRPVPAAFDAKQIEFGCGERWAMTIAWGDVSTAYRSTGIPNIRVYAGTPPGQIRRMKRLRPLLPVAGFAPVKALLKWWVGRTVTGPDASVRDAGRVYLWGRAADDEGQETVATFDTPEGYHFTALAAVESARRALAGEVESGALTPSLAFGADFVGEIEGVSELRFAG